MTQVCNKHSNVVNTELTHDNDNEMVDQITSVQSYLDTLRKNPVGIKFRGQHRRSYISQKQPSSKMDSERTTAQFAESNPHNEKFCMSSCCGTEGNLVISAHLEYDTLSNIASGERGKRTCLNSNIACATPNSSKPFRISSSIKDIQGMLVSNLDAKTSYFNNSSVASLTVSESPFRKVDLNASRNCDKFCVNTNGIKTQGLSSKKIVKAASSENSIFHNYDVPSLSKVTHSLVTSKLLPEDYHNAQKHLFNKKHIKGANNVNFAPGISIPNIYNTLS